MRSVNSILDKKRKKIICILPAFNEEGKIGKATCGFLSVRVMDVTTIILILFSLQIALLGRR